MTSAPAPDTTTRTGIVPDIALAERLFDELRARTGSAGAGITRTSYGLGEQIAHDAVRREATRLGMHAEIDAACNLYLTMKGNSDGPGLMIGSHLDSVPDGGNFDGAAGVLAGLAVAAGFHAAGQKPPVDLTIMAVRAEESTWFGASYIGSRAAFGLLASGELDGVLRAGDAISLGAAIDAAGGDTAQLRAGTPYLDAARIGLFLEPHIEQGPVLVAEDTPVGLVTGIRGSFRHRQASCRGVYAHSGATPKSARQDAVLATSHLVVAMDEAWQRLEAEGHDLAVTFGQSSTVLGEAAFSKVAGRTNFSLDVRSQDAETLDLMRKELQGACKRIEQRHGVTFNLGPETTSTPAIMDPAVTNRMAALAEKAGIPARVMPCGAGHDAAVFAGQGVPTAMVFIRNRNGSHNPDEAMDVADFARAAELIAALLESWDPAGM
ncbi:Zn-dependent hydrolase [Allosediminivita pacifica]|uniref:N-carbamoyl-L-amino-acid hydrolase n=1 Tax=Allosediminivita pacifica TaxID=1267769 RepID=A0A2T6ANG4_9RHOB|nr:Zn-dependent hydrolase [Allosediminivita pacifica]PTX45359.1 N-carbamoyl-L-amino-acid hydrolase [Allosediminivita pacifica]GGB20631.1 Zn-dependent hydrolase [Allosediminivita pacifica]